MTSKLLPTGVYEGFDSWAGRTREWITFATLKLLLLLAAYELP